MPPKRKGATQRQTRRQKALAEKKEAVETSELSSSISPTDSSHVVVENPLSTGEDTPALPEVGKKRAAESTTTLKKGVESPTKRAKNSVPVSSASAEVEAQHEAVKVLGGEKTAKSAIVSISEKSGEKSDLEATIQRGLSMEGLDDATKKTLEALEKKRVRGLRFGQPLVLSGDDKKALRCVRFGVVTSPSMKSSTKEKLATTAPAPKQQLSHMERLQKRAERFGQTSAKDLVLEKRAQRFGVAEKK